LNIELVKLELNDEVCIIQIILTIFTRFLCTGYEFLTFHEFFSNIFKEVLSAVEFLKKVEKRIKSYIFTIFFVFELFHAIFYYHGG